MSGIHTHTESQEIVIVLTKPKTVKNNLRTDWSPSNFPFSRATKHI